MQRLIKLPLRNLCTVKIGKETLILKKIYVKWLDSVITENSGWLFKEDFEELKPSVCETIGFLFSDKKDYITIAQNISDDQILGIITIAKSVILEQKNLSFSSELPIPSWKEKEVEDAKKTS